MATVRVDASDQIRELEILELSVSVLRLLPLLNSILDSFIAP
jgi:hypothetical protein